MHCLGAVAEGTPSPNGVGGRGGILSVFRALGVLVCEGRIQGPPRGYKEGPHCAPPMQAVPNDHVCEEDNYLCDRYLVLVREIADRVAIGSFLCVEVVLCSDCPCGLAKAASKNPICTVPSLSIPPWQHASEILLEYWCICVVPSKSPETMNFQGLYQAVRSRLHFSQVAAWWSKSNGSEPSYIATRVVPYNEDNLRKFRDSPVEHTFPLAGNGDGNSIKVTVWALPRMEEMPFLACPMHPKMEKDEEGVARALTPTKAIPVSSAQQNPEGLVLPALVDDRLQTPCNKPGKHHCRCEEEDVSPPSPSIPRPNGERKRRRSLPCGPAEIGCVTVQPMPLPSVQESASQESKDSQSSSYPRSSSEISNNRGTIRPSQRQSYKSEESCVQSRNNLNSDNLERCFRTQLSIEEREGNVEKRYKRTVENSEPVQAKTANCSEKTCNLEKKDQPSVGKKPKEATENKGAEKNGLFENLIPFNSSLPWSFVESWNNSNANGKCAFQCLRATKPGHLNYPERTCKPAAFKDSSLVINPFRQSSPFHESNPGPSTYNQCYRSKQDTLNSACTVHQSCSKASNKSSVAETVSAGQEALESDDGTNNRGKSGRDLSQLMSKLSFPEDREKSKEEGGFLDWFSKVPGRVLGVAPSIGYVENKVKPTNLKSQELHGNEVRFKNCNLELSQREFDEVLAVLRARTPSGRRRTGLKTAKRRDRSEKSVEDCADRTTLGKCGNLEGSECSTNNIVNRAKSCDSCSHKLCRKNDQQQALDKSVGLSEIYGDKNIYDPSQRQEKLEANGPTGNLAGGSKCNNSEKRANDTAVECLQNVSNKADILLGAILRTSKDRKGSTEISNGTKPRSATATCSSGEESDGNSRVETLLDKQQPDQRTVPFEDEKSLPLAFNKRFNRFRQLFKKEQEKKAALTTEDNSQDVPPNFGQQRTYSIGNSQQPGLHDPRSSRESRAKRRIDFTDFSGDSEKPEPCTEPLELSTNGAHQNSRIYSTNYKKGQINEHGSDPETPEWQNRLHSTNEEEGGRNQADVDDERTVQKARKDCVTIIAKCNGTIQPRNCYSSSKIRNNNHKDSASVEDDETIDKGVPSAIEQERFRRSLENAASMVFHSRTGLPLTSSPAPLRRGSCCFDYDSSLNSVSSKRSALFELNTPPSPGAVSLEEADREAENAGEGEETPKRRSSSRGRPQSHALLGSFEESALNGRLEPVSTVHGFTAELGASGSFCPKHRKLPVTVFFYTLGDNDKVSTPYLAHINLGKKGYQVPRSGTIQVTLLNPLGTVVKMFVVLYDLSDMPPRSHTFLRQRTLRDKTLRYLVHLRFMSSKSGRIYLHTDIRMIICRKSDVDTASDFGSEPPKELRSYIHGPTNPKFSPRC